MFTEQDLRQVANLFAEALVETPIRRPLPRHYRHWNEDERRRHRLKEALDGVACLLERVRQPEVGGDS